MNADTSTGLWKGHRVAIEALVPICHDLNGPQLKRDGTMIVVWQKAF